MNRSAASNIHYSEDKIVVIPKYTILLGNTCSSLVPKLSAQCTLQKTQDLKATMYFGSWVFMADNFR